MPALVAKSFEGLPQLTEPYEVNGRMYVKILAKTNAVLKGKETVLKKEITYQTSFNNDFIIDEELNVYYGMNFSDMHAAEGYMVMSAFSKAILEDCYNITKSVNGTTTKFKTNVDYSKVDKTTTSVSKLNDHLIVSNRVITGFEFNSNLKFSVADALWGGMSLNLDGIKLAYTEFDDEIDYSNELDKYSTVLPSSSLLEVRTTYNDFMEKIETEYDDLNFGFDFEEFGGDDDDDNTGGNTGGENGGNTGGSGNGNDNTGDNGSEEDDPENFTYENLGTELGTSEDPKIDLSNSVYKITYTNNDMFNESGEMLVRYGEKSIFGYEIDELKSSVKFVFENSTGSIETTINVDIYNNKYYFKMTVVGSATINGETLSINEVYTYQCDSNTFYYSDTYDTITLYDGIREAESFKIEDMFDSIDSVIDMQGAGCDISKVTVTEGNKYIIDLKDVLNENFEMYGGECENQYEEFIIDGDNKIVLYSSIEKYSLLGMNVDETFKIEKYDGMIPHNIIPANYSQTEPDVTTIADFIDVMKNPSLLTGTLVDYDDFIEIFGTSDSPKMTMGSKVYEVDFKMVDDGISIEINGLVKYNGVEVEQISLITKIIIEDGEDNVNVTYYTDIFDGNIYVKVIATGSLRDYTLNETHTYKGLIEDMEYGDDLMDIYYGLATFEEAFSMDAIYRTIDYMEFVDGNGYKITKTELSNGNIKYNVDGQVVYVIDNNKIVEFEDLYLVEIGYCTTLKQTTDETITFNNNYVSYSTTLPNLDIINACVEAMLGY